MDYTAGFGLVIWWLDTIGIYVFGLSGAMLAVRHRLDLFGVMVLAVVTATAGGAMRDMAIGDHPAAVLREPLYIPISLLAALTVFFFHRAIERVSRPVMWLDAIGLGVFTVAGTQKALNFGLSPVASCVIGVMTATGGGIIRDVLIAEIPRVLREEIYAVAAALGAGIVIMGAHLGWAPLPTTTAAIAGTVALRLAAMRYGWRMPHAR